MASLTVLLATVIVGQLAHAALVPGDQQLGEVLKLTAASSHFSQNLYTEVALSQPNAIYSPFSAHACLSMAMMGARGSTAQEMTAVLQLPGVTSPHLAYHDLIQDLNGVTRVKLYTGNAMFLNPSYPIKQSYQDEVTNHYFAVSRNIDMLAPAGPEAPINAWVASKTENKIMSILPPHTIKTDTMMILINTIFFNGTWSSPFKDYATRKADFHKADGSNTQVDLMHQIHNFRLKKDAIPGVDVVSLPFKDARFSMYIALPKSKTGLPALERYVTHNDVDTLLKNLAVSNVDLYLPKFNIDASMDLNKALKNMGMSTPFSDTADFSGVSTVPMKISKVLQKATIEVQESGTVAAAVTAVIGVQITSAVLFTPPPPYLFRVDHPFMYFLKDDVTGQILFQGKIGDPSVKSITV